MKMEKRKLKFRVIGAPGSGKSYFSKKLSRQLDIEVFDLDNIFWSADKHGFRVKQNKIDRKKKLMDILENDQWIIEGVYISHWTEDTFKYSDKIILIKVNRIKQLYRILKRELIKKIKGELPKSTLKDSKDFILWSFKYTKELEDFYNKFDQKEKFIVLNNKKQVEKFLIEIGCCDD